MKNSKKVLLLLCLLLIVFAAAVYAVVGPETLPAVRETLFEEKPAENALRSCREVNGVSGSRFFIQFPKKEALECVSVSQFGAGPDVTDNAEALNEAFLYCQEHPGTRLVFEKAVYYVTGQLNISLVTDCCIDGNGAKILYDNRDGLFEAHDCECLEIRDLTFDWDWDKKPLSAIARAVKVENEKNTLDFIFDVPAYARPDILYAISECDEETETYGAKGTFIETYDGQNPDVIKKVTKINDVTLRVVHNGALARFGGKKYILRSDAYGGSVMRIENSHNVTLDGLNLYGGTGMGIIVGEKASHFAICNVFIGPDPEYADVRCTSLDADAIHINDVGGCFLIEGCDISRQGDDDVNINSGIGIVRKIEGNAVYFDADGSMDTDPGQTIAFRDKKFNLMNATAVVESCDRIGYKLRKVTFKGGLPAGVKKDCTLFNANVTGNNYVIRNNYFHEHRARGLLLQTSDGLVENNVFYKTSHDAIRIVMDISTGLWNEGTGADNIEIRNNTFIECGVIGTETIEIGTHIDGKSGASFGFTNIRITDNEFRDICGYLLVVNNTNNFVFSGNKITVGTAFRPDVSRGRSYFMSSCRNVDLSGNVYTDVSALSLTRLIRSDDPFVWARVNISASERKGGAK